MYLIRTSTLSLKTKWVDREAFDYLFCVVSNSIIRISFSLVFLSKCIFDLFSPIFFSSVVEKVVASRSIFQGSRTCSHHETIKSWYISRHRGAERKNWDDHHEANAKYWCKKNVFLNMFISLLNLYLFILGSPMWKNWAKK